MTYSYNINISQEKYIEIISEKTASLFEATCESAATLSEVNNKQINALKQFGYNIGISFQILDDILDYTASETQFGKKLGNDLLTGKITLPIIIAYQNADHTEKKFWSQLSINPDINKAMLYIKSHTAIEQALKIASIYIANAKSSLNIFADSDYKQVLYKLLDSILYRNFSVNNT